MTEPHIRGLEEPDIVRRTSQAVEGMLRKPRPTNPLLPRIHVSIEIDPFDGFVDPESETDGTDNL